MVRHTALGFMLLLMGSVVSACGVTTHNYIAHRALHYANWEEHPEFIPLLQKYPYVFQAGAAFPDWGYDCKGYGAESEAAHWPPFMRNATDYLHQNYQRPWNEDAAVLAVFLLGVVSHSVADISWHGIAGIAQGFIDAEAGQNFNGSYPLAHTTADVGAEFVCSYDYDLSFLEDYWFAPVPDLVRIYHQMNFTKVNEKDLSECMLLLFSEVTGIKEAGWSLYPWAATQSSFLVEWYQDYFNGGVDDMAQWTTWCWPSAIRWMYNGSDPNYCLIEPKDDSQHQHNPTRTHDASKVITPKQKLVQSQREKVTISKQQDGSYFMPKSDRAEKVGIQLSQDHTNDVTLPHQIFHKDVSLFINQSYAYLGTSFAKGDLNGDFVDDLIISSPGWGTPGNAQTGCIFVVFSGPEVNSTWNSILDIEKVADIVLCGSESRGRFGSSVAVIDFNVDGRHDIVVGAPGIGAKDYLYDGRVYVYLAREDHTFSKTPDITIAGENKYHGLGQVMTKGDCNFDNKDDLILGSPYAASHNFTVSQAGRVEVFYSSASRVSGQVLTAKNANLTLHGDASYGWFGFSVKYVEVGPMLLVGAPTFTNISNAVNQSVGRVYAYQISSTPTLQFSIVGLSHFEQLGFAMDVGYPTTTLHRMLALGAPGRFISNPPLLFGQGGCVFLLPLDILLKLNGKTVNIEELQPQILTTFNGDLQYGHFGWSVKLSDLDGDGLDELVTGAPDHDYNYRSQGLVYLWKGGPTFPTGTIWNLAESATAVFYNAMGITDTKKSETTPKEFSFGWAIETVDLDANGHTDLIASARKDSSHAVLGGTIDAFFL